MWGYYTCASHCTTATQIREELAGICWSRYAGTGESPMMCICSSVYTQWRPRCIPQTRSHLCV